MTPADITGLVLAGGRGSRMGGADKGLVEWKGLPLARHALDRLAPQVGSVAVNANRNIGTYAAWQLPVWRDGDDRFPGPLAGLLAGLNHCSTDWLATVPCDCPLFPADLVARLARVAVETDRLVVMAATARPGGSDPQPVFMLLHRSLRESLAHAVEQGDSRVRRWAEAQGCAMAIFDDPAPFANANTLEDLAALPPAAD